MHRPPPIGVGLQYNPEILDWFPFEEQDVDLLEILVDTVMGALDSPYVLKPGADATLARLGAKHPLLAHSNYGCDFGFEPLETTAAVRRHIEIVHRMKSPWAVNHCLYGDASWMDMWSSPVQFSAAEARRMADRARHLQELYGLPLAHENAAYYLRCPGGDLREAEFLARLVSDAGTWLHLDLHNIYTNSVNMPDYSIDDYLATIPLDRVLSIHIAGGSWHEGLYHDWHDSKVPEPVWNMVEHVLSRGTPSALVLEFQGQAHHPGTRVLSREEDYDMIVNDVARAKRLWQQAQTSKRPLEMVQ